MARRRVVGSSCFPLYDLHPAPATGHAGTVITSVLPEQATNNDRSSTNVAVSRPVASCSHPYFGEDTRRSTSCPTTTSPRSRFPHPHSSTSHNSLSLSRRNRNICGIAAVVFGALGLVLSFIPIVNNIAAILGFIGVILAIIAIVGTFRGKKRGKVLSIVAAVLSVLAIVITLAMQSAASKAIDDSIKESKGIDTSQSSSSKSAGKSSDASKSKASEQKAQGEQDLEGDIEGAHVKIVSAVKSVNDYNGKPTALVTYEWTNNTSKNNSFATLAHPNVFQNGTELETAVYFDQPEGYDANSYLAQAQPGTAATVTLGYVLQDDSPITVDVTAFLSTDQDTKVTHTFTLQ